MDSQSSFHSFPSNVAAILQDGVEYMSEAQLREVKPFRCTICQKGFATEAYFKQHYRIHTGEKAYGPCGTCGKSFRQLSHLQQHVRSHSGDKPYKCPVPGCGKYFGQLGNLKCHNKRVHCGKKKKKNSPKSIKPQPPESQPGSPNAPFPSELANTGASSSLQIYRDQETPGSFSGFNPKEEIVEPNPSAHQSPIPAPAIETPIFDFHGTAAAATSAQPQQMDEMRDTAEPDEIFDDSILDELEQTLTLNNEWFESECSAQPKTREAASTGEGNKQSSWSWLPNNIDHSSQMFFPPQEGFVSSFQSGSIGPSIATSDNVPATNQFPSGKGHYQPRQQESFRSGHQIRPHFPMRRGSVPTDRSSGPENNARQGSISEFHVFDRPQAPEAQAASRYEDWKHTSPAQGPFRGTVHSLTPIRLPGRIPGPQHPHSTIASARNYSVPNFPSVSVPNSHNYPPCSSTITSFSFLEQNISEQHLPSQWEETGGSTDSFFSGRSHNPSMASSNPGHSVFPSTSLNPGTENFSAGVSHHDTIGFAAQNHQESSDTKSAFNSVAPVEPQPGVPLLNHSASPQELIYPQPIRSRRAGSSFTSSLANQTYVSSNPTQINSESGGNDAQEEDFWSSPTGVFLMKHTVMPALRSQARTRSNTESNNDSMH